MFLKPQADLLPVALTNGLVDSVLVGHAHGKDRLNHQNQGDQAKDSPVKKRRCFVFTRRKPLAKIVDVGDQAPQGGDSQKRGVWKIPRPRLLNDKGQVKT